MEKQIRKIIKDDSQNPVELENLLQNLAGDNAEFSYLLEKFRLEKKKILAKSWSGWFQRLGWWFAKLLMYGALVSAVLIIGAVGKKAVDPLTYGLIGAAFYYVIIQLFTPGRMKRETDSFIIEDEKQLLGQLFAQIDEEKAD